MSLHNRIKEARKNAGVTQSALAAYLGVAKTTVSGWENDKEPSAPQIAAIADFLDTSVSFLLQDEVAEYGSKNRQPAKEGELSKDAEEVIQLLRRVPDQNRPLATALVRNLLYTLIENLPIPEESQSVSPPE